MALKGLISHSIFNICSIDKMNLLRYYIEAH